MRRRLFSNTTFNFDTVASNYDFHLNSKYITRNFAANLNLGAQSTSDAIITIAFAPLAWSINPTTGVWSWVAGANTTIVATSALQAAGTSWTSKPDTYGKPQTGPDFRIVVTPSGTAGQVKNVTLDIIIDCSDQED